MNETFCGKGRCVFGFATVTEHLLSKILRRSANQFFIFTTLEYPGTRTMLKNNVLTTQLFSWNNRFDAFRTKSQATHVNLSFNSIQWTNCVSWVLRTDFQIGKLSPIVWGFKFECSWLNAIRHKHTYDTNIFSCKIYLLKTLSDQNEY